MMITSASFDKEVRAYPACPNFPKITSLSTRFFGHPKDIKFTFILDYLEFDKLL